jgi:hypothetical protein
VSPYQIRILIKFLFVVQDLPSSSIYNRVASEYISALNEAEEEKSGAYRVH